MTAILALLLVAGWQVPADTNGYLVLVGSEATDEIALIRFTPSGGEVVRRHMVGINPVEPDGPHGMGVSPDGKSYFVSTAHGLPFGELSKFSAEGGFVARTTLGLFPATLQVSPDGRWVYVVNANFHGDMVPSSVSVVAADEMVEVARIDTCTMPHGSRFNAAGTRHYSACMMDEQLVEIDATRLEVARRFVLTKGNEHAMAAGKLETGNGKQDSAAADHSGHGLAAPPAGSAKCTPTWAVPSPDGGTVYVACNAANDIVEIDVESWAMRRRIPAGEGVYNLAVTHDGSRIVATNKRGQSVSVFDAASGRELARIATIRRVVHGVVISHDDRYAFISVEGYGSEPGTVEMIDLKSLQRVASVDVGQMAGGIDVLR